MTLALRKKTTAIALTVGTLVGVGLVVAPSAAFAYAGTGYNGYFDATCDPVNYGYATDGVRYLYNTGDGYLGVTQRSTSPVSSSNVKMVNDAGIATGVLSLTDGALGMWYPVNGYYYVYARRTTQANCNGILPGSGNYAFNFTVWV